MFEADLAFPLSAGLVAAFNPCGFAMLPAYLAYFLGLESDEEASSSRNIFRGLRVGLTLSAGFVFLFGVIGVLTNTVVSESAIESRIGYATFGFGILMVPLGIAMLFGFEPKLRLPRMQAGTGSRELPSIFMFGISYAIVSISCTAPIFFGSVIGSFGRESFVDSLAVFIAYALGMSLVIMTLTLGIAMARTGIATNMRRFLPYVNRVSGGLLVIAGAFLAWYGWWEIQIARGSSESNALVDLSNDASARLQEWINDVGTGRFAMATVVIIVGALTWALTAGLTRRSDRLILRGGFVVVYLLIEAVRYEFDLLILPLLRTVADIPERVSNWFTDPGRWPVLFEVALASVLIAIAFFWTRHMVARTRGRDSATPTDSREDTLNVSV
ncbi:MAG: cytochrome c biogenesis CcdA family protein [Acidimicrobiales bacterium]